VYSDLVESIKLYGQSKEYYFIKFLNDHLYYLKVTLLKSKEKVEEDLKNLIEHFQVETEYQLNYFHTDRDGEYTSESLKKYFVSKKIHYELTNLDTPQENSSAEHINYIILDITYVMIRKSNLLESL